MVQHRMLMPAAAERLIELDQTLQDVPLCLNEQLFGRQPLPLRIEHFQVAADPTGVALGGEAALIAQSGCQRLPGGAEIFGLLVADQGVGDIPKSSLDRALIADQKLFALAFGRLIVSGAQAGIEDRSIYNSQ